MMKKIHVISYDGQYVEYRCECGACIWTGGIWETPIRYWSMYSRPITCAECGEELDLSDVDKQEGDIAYAWMMRTLGEILYREAEEKDENCRS